MNISPLAGALPLRSESAAASSFRLASVRGYLTLLKPRIVSLVLFTAVVACFAAAGGRPTTRVLLVLIGSGFLSASGSAALNHWFDRDADARMSRTRTRPLPAGVVPSSIWIPVAAVTMALLGVAVAALINPSLAFFNFVGGITYVAIYTLWLKRRTSLNIVIGGFAGSAAVLGGWAAIDPRLGLAPWLLAGVVFFWTPAHFWSLAIARSDDYAKAGVPMLPLVAGVTASARWATVHLLATVFLSLWLGAAARLGWLYFAVALISGLWFGSTGLRLLRSPNEANGWLMFKVSGPYLGLVFSGVLASTQLHALGITGL